MRSIWLVLVTTIATAHPNMDPEMDPGAGRVVANAIALANGIANQTISLSFQPNTNLVREAGGFLRWAPNRKLTSV